jgi:hypothetical protein
MFPALYPRGAKKASYFRRKPVNNALTMGLRAGGAGENVVGIVGNSGLTRAGKGGTIVEPL